MHILSVSGLLHNALHLCPEVLAALHTQDGSDCLWTSAIQLLAQDQQLRIHFNALEGSYALCLTANLVQLLSLSPGGLAESTGSVVTVLAHLLSACSQYVTAKQSNLCHWNPVLGWFSVSLDLEASMGQVKTQLAMLWSPDCVRLMTSHLSLEAASLPAIPSPPSPGPQERNFGKKLVLQAIEKTKTTYAATTQAVSLVPSINRLGNSAYTKVTGLTRLFMISLFCCLLTSWSSWSS